MLFLCQQKLPLCQDSFAILRAQKGASHKQSHQNQQRHA
jgi:hypothetical protein